jgi:hypothetical protein
VNYYIPNSANLFWEFIKNLQILVSCQSWEYFPFIMIYSNICLITGILNFIQNWSKFFIPGICSKIVWIEPYQDVFLDSKGVLDVIYASWRIGNVSSFKNKAKIHLKSKFIELWRDQMLRETNGKLRTYITFKSNFGREKYLSVLKRFEQRIDTHKMN